MVKTSQHKKRGRPAKTTESVAIRSEKPAVEAVAGPFGFSGARLRQARRAKKLTQSELAKRVDSARGTVIRWEANINEPHKDQLRMLSQVLEQDPSWFFEWGPSSGSAPAAAEDQGKNPVVALPQSLREAMRRHGDSVYSLAKRLAVDVQLLRDWMGGYARPSASHLQKIRTVLGDDFANGNGSRSKGLKLDAQPAPESMFSMQDKLDLLLVRVARVENLLLEALARGEGEFSSL